MGQNRLKTQIELLVTLIEYRVTYIKGFSLKHTIELDPFWSCILRNWRFRKIFIKFHSYHGQHSTDRLPSKPIFDRETPVFCLYGLKIYSRVTKNCCHLALTLMVKSVHFWNPVTRSSFLSKALSFLLKSKQSQRKWQRFWKKWGSRNWFLKINEL